MKLVINKCYGGFGLSAKAMKRYAELKGKECYFFDMAKSFSGEYVPVSVEKADKLFGWFHYTVPDPQNYRLSEIDSDGLYKGANARAREITLEVGDRSDPDLIRVVEELGKAANGRHSELEIVEIPDGVDFEINDYDGMESVHEAHRVWG